ncbi:hypothetical protein LUZ62_077224 [Rhynchospora pubera]|uniref:DUF547 domain-containing protein n=1 Tax=Rhynchospora pubera TaxID=906938 RepID=A0AAV8DFR1_9POAL|nr:hypothetical protein LUZ62_077224 [Rhynchospora pubera]
MEEASSSVSSIQTKHKRSLSDSDRRIKSSASRLQGVREMEHNNATKDVNLCTSEAPASLKKEIQELEKLLHDQFLVRHALEKALGHKSHAFSSSSNDNSIPNSTKEMIKDIAILELEVMYLEQHLLSMYRKAFMQHIPTSTLQTPHADLMPSSASSQVTSDASSNTRQARYVQSNRMTLPRKSDTGLLNGPTIPVSVRPREKQHILGRSHSSLLHLSVGSARVSPAEKNLRALKPCYTSPLTFQEDKQDMMDSSVIVSLAQHLGARVSDHVTLTPNKISEELVRCMGTIYYKLKDHSNCNNNKYNSGTYRGFSSSSPCSSFSSVSAFSSNYVGDIWSPQSKRATCSTEFSCMDGIGVINDAIKDFTGPHNLFYEVSSLGEVYHRPQEVEDLLQQYRSLVDRLEMVDPAGLMKEERLAFWINVHNAMIMHAHLDGGNLHNNKKRLESVSKVAYEIKGQKVNAEIVKSQILGYSKNLTGQWLKLLLYGRAKSKEMEEWLCFPVDHQEPLLHFSLCFGSHSDPAVRIYNPKRVYHQLEIAKEEYIRSRICIRKEHCMLLPRLLGCYAKDANLNLEGLLDMIECFLPQSLRVILQNCDRGRSRRIIEWMPHNLTFRYLILREVATFQAI